MDHIRVAIHIEAFRILQAEHLDLLLLDALFKGKQRHKNGIGQVKARHVQPQLAAVDARKIQHRAHQTRQTLNLLGNDLQVMRLLFRRDSPIQNAVDKSGDRCHRRFQFVGNIGNEIPAHALAAGQGRGHIVKRERELPHLVVAGDRDPYAEIPLAKAPGRQRHVAQGAHKLIGKHPADAKGHQKRRDRC